MHNWKKNSTTVFVFSFFDSFSVSNQSLKSIVGKWYIDCAFLFFSVKKIIWWIIRPPATCYLTFDLLSQPARLDSDVHFVVGWLCPHAKVIRDTYRAAGLFSLSQGPSASKEPMVWGLISYVLCTQLYLHVGSCIGLSLFIAGKVKAIIVTDEPWQLCGATKLSKGQWGHTWQAAWLRDITCVSVCAWGWNGEKLFRINVIEFWWERLMEQWFH